MKQRNQLRSGVLLTYLNLILGSLIPMFYTPVMLNLLGQSEYGLYGLAHSVSAYLSLLSFGLGSTIVRYLAIFRAKNDKDGEQRMIGMFVAIYCVIGVVVFAAGWTISCFAGQIFQNGLTAEEIDKIRILIRIMSFNLAISFPISVFSSIVTAHERYIYRQIVGILTTVAAPLLNLIALWLGYASIGMAIAGTAMQVLVLPLYAGYCFSKLHIKPSFRRVRDVSLREVFGFSLFVFLGSLVDILFWSTDKVILGMEASTAVVAVYNIGVTFNTIFTSLSTAVSGVLQPKVTIMIEKKAPMDQLSELFIRIGRLQFLLIALVLSGFLVFGRAFLQRWAGPEYSESYWIAIVTLIPLTIPLIQNTGISIVTAQNKHKFRSLTYLVIAVVNVISTYLLVPYLGGFGAALCSGVSYIVGQGLIMNLYYAKVTGLQIGVFWKQIFRLAIVPGVLLVLGLLCTRFIDFGVSWLRILAGALTFAALYAAGQYLLAMNAYEKSIVSSALHKIFGRMRRSQ